MPLTNPHTLRIVPETAVEQVVPFRHVFAQPTIRYLSAARALSLAGRPSGRHANPRLAGVRIGSKARRDLQAHLLAESGGRGAHPPLRGHGAGRRTRFRHAGATPDRSDQRRPGPTPIGSALQGAFPGRLAVPADPPGVSVGERRLHGAPHPDVHVPHLRGADPPGRGQARQRTAAAAAGRRLQRPAALAGRHGCRRAHRARDGTAGAVSADSGISCWTCSGSAGRTPGRGIW